MWILYTVQKWQGCWTQSYSCIDLHFCLRIFFFFFFARNHSNLSGPSRATNFLHAFRFGLGYSFSKYLFSFGCDLLPPILNRTWLSKLLHTQLLLCHNFILLLPPNPQKSVQPLKKAGLLDLQIGQPGFLQVQEDFLGGPRQDEFRVKNLPDLEISKYFLFMDSLMPNAGFMRSLPLMRC